MKKIKVGLVGYGKAGKAVVNVLKKDLEIEFCWVIKKSVPSEDDLKFLPKIVNIEDIDNFNDFFKENEVDAIIDFSVEDSILKYGIAI